MKIKKENWCLYLFDKSISFTQLVISKKTDFYYSKQYGFKLNFKLKQYEQE